MTEDTFSEDSIILRVLKENLGKNNAEKVFKSLSGIQDSDLIIEKLQTHWKEKIPKTRFEKILSEFSDAVTILPESKDKIPETSEDYSREYDIQKELGRGGMGAVYQAEESLLEREVAMKKIIGSATDSAVKRFIREAKVTAKLDHPNIVSIHDFGLNEQGEYYFTMNRVKGEDLKEIINKIDNQEEEYIEKYSLNKKLQIYKGLLDAVSFAHSKGIIHRDLKPANIMVGQFGEVQVMDWGLAKDTSKEDIVSEGELKETRKGLTLDGQVMGSPGFMAPEQADGRIEDVDALSDVWSLGAMLYYMLSFEKPIDGESVREIVINTAKGKIIPLRKKARNVPKELESIVMKAVAPERKDRYQSVNELNEDIDAYLDRRPVSAHAYGISEKIKKWVQRHPTAAISAGIATVLLSISGVVGGFLYNWAETETKRADEATLDKKAAEFEVKGQQKSEAILGSLKFLKQNEDYYKAGLSIINKAINESENYWKPYLVLAKHQADFSHHEEAEKNFEKANEVYRKQFNKDSVEIFFEAGMYYGLPGIIGGRGLEEKALQFFKKGHKAGPEKVFGKLAHILSLVIESSLKPKKAEENLSRAIVLSDLLIEDNIAKSIDATWLANAWLHGTSVFASYDLPVFKKFQNLEKARNALQHVVTEQTGKIGIRNFLAVIQLNLSEYETAIKIFSDCLKTQQESYIYFNRGNVYKEKGDLEKAIADYDEVIRLNPKDADAYNNRGLAYEKKGDPDKAIKDYNEAIRLKPKYNKAYFNRGAIHGNKGELDKAIADFDKVISLSPEDISAYNSRGKAHERKGEFDKALKDFDIALSLDPNNAETHFNIGHTYGEKSDLEKAIEAYTRAINLDPKDVVSYINRAIQYGNKGELDKAIEDFVKAINLDPKNSEAYRNRGSFYGNKGKLEKAMQDFEMAINLDPNNVNAYNDRGLLHRKKGELEKAIEDFNKAIDLDPNNVIAYSYRGTAYWKKGELEKVIEDFNKAIDLDPNHTAAYIDRGVFWEHVNNLDKALEDYTKAISIDPNYAKAYLNRGNVHGTKGELDKAIKNFSKAISLEPKNTEAYIKRALAHRYLKQWEKAIEDYTTCINLNPTDISIYSKRSYAYRFNGKPKNAIKDQNTILSLDPKNVTAYINLGLIYEEEGQLEKAMQNLNKAINLDPKNGGAYCSRGLVHQNKGDLEKAIEDFNESIRLNPNFFNSYIYRGSTYLKRGELEKAIEDFNTVIKLHPNYPTAYSKRGGAYNDKGEFKKAVEDYTKAIELSPNDGTPYANRANNYVELSKFSEAEADIKKALSLGFNPAYIILGELHMKKRDYDKALSAFKEAYEKAPEYKSSIDKLMEKLKQKINENK